ncbi:hypothetical protein [Paracoccus aerius]|uniref:Uncharacterized protein n=1 Tax=Paracoccus aerius TaxID=1915382 RepID=A0ABS1S567_9RHOB|nr:hypothetical protein [Paracoccus aerius]MBL3673851.1 hypothetical protein [Paracoccus aerius]GHG28142.1 hypothetical protein GCM10017322_28400 [Paracoccus aerius]
MRLWHDLQGDRDRPAIDDSRRKIGISFFACMAAGEVSMALLVVSVHTCRAPFNQFGPRLSASMFIAMAAVTEQNAVYRGGN